MGLDNRVWRTLLIMILIPLFFMSYRLITHDVKCTPITFKATSLSFRENGIYYTGDVLSFTASIPSESIDWSFGDNTSDAGENVHHQYMNEGKYLVRASGNSLCAYQIEINIQNRPSAPSANRTYKGKISGQTTFYSKSDQTFTYPDAAGSYKWSVNGKPNLGTKMGQTVSFKFPSKGSYTIHVMLDGDANKWDELEVSVVDEVISGPNPKPRPIGIEVGGGGPIIDITKDTSVHAPIDSIVKPPEPAGPRMLSPVTLKLYLEAVQRKEKTVADFKPYGIVESTPVVANGKEYQNFGWLCNEIIKTRKSGIWPFKKTESVVLGEVSIQRINNIVSVINVSYEYK